MWPRMWEYLKIREWKITQSICVNLSDCVCTIRASLWSACTWHGFKHLQKDSYYNIENVIWRITAVCHVINIVNILVSLQSISCYLCEVSMRIVARFATLQNKERNTAKNIPLLIQQIIIDNRRTETINARVFLLLIGKVWRKCQMDSSKNS